MTLRYKRMPSADHFDRSGGKTVLETRVSDRYRHANFILILVVCSETRLAPVAAGLFRCTSQSGTILCDQSNSWLKGGNHHFGRQKTVSANSKRSYALRQKELADHSRNQLLLIGIFCLFEAHLEQVT